MKWIIGIAATLIALLVGALIRAYVIAQLWGWFMAPAFHVPEITMSTAFGLSLFASLFLPPPQTPDSEGMDTPALIGKLVGAFLGQLLGYGFVLMLGGLVHDATSSG
jgi:hypothetical protein